MLALIQRVSSASVVIDGTIVGEIDSGIMLLLGIQKKRDITANPVCKLAN